MGEELTGVLLVARGDRDPGDTTLTLDSGLPGLDPALLAGEMGSYPPTWGDLRSWLDG